MARYGYDISDTSYTQFMNDKNNQYAGFIRKAEITNRDNSGEPTKAEAQYYLEASKICAEIVNKNLSQRDVCAKWERRKIECEQEVRRIVAALTPSKPTGSAQVPVDDYETSAASPAPVKAAKSTKAADSAKEAAKSPEGNPEFVTKNACRDVTAETISSWYKDKPKHNFDNVSGMEDIKTMLREQIENLEFELINSKLAFSPVQSYFFYGPAGCGKTFIIEAFASELIEKYGYKFIRLLGGDIHASLVGVAEKTVEIAFKEAIDNEPCIIFIDEVENVCVNRSDSKAEGHEKRLTVAFLEAYNLLLESGKHVIFMGATNYPSKVDNAMLDRVKTVKIPLPPVEARKSYFDRGFKELAFEYGFDTAEMAEMTDNSSYRDLGRVKDDIYLKLQKAAIASSLVMNEDGTINKEETDKAGAEAISSGVVKITREMVEQTLKTYPPSSKIDIQEELEAFENSLSK